MGSTAPQERGPVLPQGLGAVRALRMPGVASTTLEVRWIHRGPVPEEVIAWLGPFDAWVWQRQDRYLVDPPVPDLGVKIKDGVQLDLKGFRGSLGRLMIPGTGRGRLELWEKWSFPLHASALPPADAPAWLALDKTRRRRSFRIGAEGVVERPVEQAELPGCSVELTEVAIGERRWWTLALEANGDRETLETNLQATVARLFRGPSPDPKLLDLRHSMSYARWLAGSRSLRGLGSRADSS
jgi:hypothetical protein